MILATQAGDRQARSLGGMFAGIDVIPLPAVGVGQLGSWSVSGRRVTPEIAVGLPAIMRGVRLIAESIASMPLLSINEDATGNHERATGTWQWELLHDKPNDTQKTPFAFKEYLVASMLMRGNAFALKAKSRGRVQALYPISPRRVWPKYLKDGETLTYEVRKADGHVVTLTDQQMLHIPGILLDDPCIGVSPLTVAANALGTALGTEEFAGRFMDNDATPAGILEFPGGANTQAAKDTRDTWEDRHRGARNAHKVAALFGGATYKQIGVDANAAQIIESQKWTIDQSARILGLPSWALGGIDQNPRSTPEQRNSELMTLSILPWIERFLQGLQADMDLYPTSSPFPFFESDHFVRAEMFLRYQGYTQARQAGWLSINDVRRKENLPPIEGGDEYQTTPVGGAPNQQPNDTDDDDDDDEPHDPVPADPDEEMGDD